MPIIIIIKIIIQVFIYLHYVLNKQWPITESMIRAQHINKDYCYYWQWKQFPQENKLILSMHTCAYCSGCHSKGSLQFPARWKSPHHDREVQWALLRQCSWSQKLFGSWKFIETNNRSVMGRSEDQYWQYLRHIRTHPVTRRFRRKIQILTIKKLRGLGPRATAACRRNLCQLLRRRGCRVVSAANPLWP
jgi:hypothetical protein